MMTPYTSSEAPPPYPGPSSAFVLPLYETATAADYWVDSSCLPPYQSRTGQRFHPYMRILPVHRGYIPHQEKSFEEFYRSLQASASRRAVTPPVVVESPTAAPLPPPAQASTDNPTAAPPPVVDPPALEGVDQEDPEERRRRLVNRLFLLPEIIKVVRAGLGAAMRVAQA